MKKTVQSYPSYEEANDAQITLLAAGIDCKVVRHAQGVWDISEGRNESYGIVVDGEKYEESKDLLSHHIPEDFVSLIQCPYCQSNNGKRYSYYDSPLFMLTWILLIPMIWSMCLMRKEGRRYKCEDCQRLYRIKL